MQEQTTIMELNIIYNADCLQGLQTLPDNSVDCCVTSPPYYGLRDYGTATWVGGNPDCEHLAKYDGYASSRGNLRTARGICPACGAKRIDSQIGLETTPEAYINKLVEVFAQVYRILKPTGTLWLNIGDSYHSRYTIGKHQYIKSKDLIGIPWMLAFALRERGWYLRQDIIWHKSNPMPDNVKDRFTKSHEYIFLLTKSARYYFDRRAIVDHVASDSSIPTPPRNKRDVWSVCTKSVNDGHFAGFPENLIVDCVKTGCPQDGVVLDPFMGSGTTAVVARKLNRNYIGFELNPEYIKISNTKIYNKLGIFK